MNKIANAVEYFNSLTKEAFNPIHWAQDNPDLVRGGLLGGGLGLGAGYFGTDNKDKRGRNALLGLLAGGAAGATIDRMTTNPTALALHRAGNAINRNVANVVEAATPQSAAQEQAIEEMKAAARYGANKLKSLFGNK